MKEGEVDVAVTLEADAQATEAVEPGKKALDLPAVRGDFRMRVRTIAALVAGRRPAHRNAVTDAAPGEVTAKAAAVVTSVGGQRRGAAAGPATGARHADGFQSRLRGTQVMDICRRQVQPQRHPVSIDDDMAFAGYARPRAPGFVAPFFAFT